MNLSMADRLHGAIEAYEHQRLDDPEHDAWVELDILHARAILSLLNCAKDMAKLLFVSGWRHDGAGILHDCKCEWCVAARVVLEKWEKLNAKDLSNA